MCVKIRTLGLILSYVVIVFYCSALKLQQNGTMSVPANQSQCFKVNQTIAQGKVPECYCDSKCSDYRDCCLKSTFKANASKPFQNCTSFANGDFYVQRYCPRETRRCAVNYSFVNIKNLKNKIPVTSLKTGMSYGNKHCAACYNVTDFQLWNVNVTCDNYSDYLTVFDNTTRPYLTINRNLSTNFKYNKKLKTWQIPVANVTKNCTLRPAVPDNLKQTVRPCIPNVISQCTTLTFAQLLCNQHQSIYIDANTSKMYRNKYCAWCSGAITDISLLRDNDTFSSILPTSRSPTTLKVTSTPAATTTTNSTSTPSTSRTARTTSRATTTSRPQTPGYKHIARNYLHISIRDGNYTETLSRINMTKILTETRYYTNIRRTYIRNFTEIQGNKIRTCNTSSLPKSKDSNQIPKIVPISFNIVLLLGSAFLGLSMRHFVAPQSANYQYRCVIISYTIAMLISNGGWFFKNILNDSVEQLFVPFDHVVNYFAFLTSLASATTMAFHVSCTSWKAYYQFSAIKNNAQSKNLYLYSTITWFLPAIMSMSKNSTFDMFPTSNVNANLHLLIFFIIPFIIVFSVNLSFYVNSAILIATQKEVEEKLKKLEINFNFFSALLWITHLMWVVALSFCYIKSYLLIVLFYVLNLIVCLLVYCIASGSKIFSVDSVQFSGDKSSLVIVNKAE